MPRALPAALRARVMDLVAEGLSKTDIARQLRISRMTVHRYVKAAQEQKQQVPEPRPAGGYRHSKVTRAEISALAALSLQHPKETVDELQQRAIREGILSSAVPVSRATVWRALKKAGVSHKRAAFYDLRTVTEPGIAYERRAFRTAQKRDPLFSSQNLLFFDETLVRLNEQQTRGWATTGAAHLPKPKGQSLTTAVFLTLGSGGVLHYSLYPPARRFQPLPARYQASELKQPGKGVEVGLTLGYIQRTATVQELRDILKQQHIKLSDEHGRALTKQALRDTVCHLKTQGQVGLLRAARGRPDLGGAPQAFRGTTRDVTRYWLESFLPWAEEQKLELAHKTIVWDNAPSHSAVRTNQTQRISVFHRWFREWGFHGVVFTPPRSPSFNPAELCFAYIKRWIRKWAPDEGYTQTELEAAIQRAVAKVTPTMVEHWVAGCGYKQQHLHTEEEEANPEDGGEDTTTPAGPLPAELCSLEEPLPRRIHLLCLNEQGTLVKEKRPGETRWTYAGNCSTGQLHNVVPQRVSAPPLCPQPPTTLLPHEVRWAGYGSGPPAGIMETHPEVGFLRDDVFEPEAIVAERLMSSGKREYCVRWKGYDAKHDTWEPQQNLLVGAQQLLRDWRRRDIR